MIKIDHVLVSEELKDNYFACHLKACHGDCCVEGDAGAPLEEEEISMLEDYIDKVMPFMTVEGKKVIEKNGVFDYDADGEYVTPLVNNRECAFVYQVNSINFCAIEKSFLEGMIKFQKPVSCHLYPIRVSPLKTGVALNYHRWSICEPARILGKKEQVPVFRFLKDPISRVYGSEFYEELEIVYKELSMRVSE